ncbi:MAG TPA: hypothetical protein VK576_04715, partial [Thermoleophilia bacterium]|nr:hypothetical protein [Thermoleophilia bacterium]
MSLYERLAGLELVVEGYEIERHEQPVSSDFTRVTTVVSLHGRGEVGRGEDVTYDAPDHDTMPTGLGLGWAGSFSGFSRRLGYLPLFPSAPTRAASLDYRRWAFE